MWSASTSTLFSAPYGTAYPLSHIHLLTLVQIPSSHTQTSASTRPNLPLESASGHLSSISISSFSDATAFRHHSLSFFFERRPNFFSSWSEVRDSGVSMPKRRTRCFVQTSKPRSILTSIVSPSTTFSREDTRYLKLQGSTLYEDICNHK